MALDFTHRGKAMRLEEAGREKRCCDRYIQKAEGKASVANLIFDSTQMGAKHLTPSKYPPTKTTKLLPET